MMAQGKRYMSDFEAKKAIIDIGQRMYQRGFVAANDGNISCRVGPNAVWATPTNVSKGFMTQDMLIKVDMQGKVLLGRAKPSSELKMHLRVYEENPEVMGVTHAHPPVATSFAIAGISLDQPILPEGVVQLGTVPVAHYATPGTQDVPDSIAPYCKTHNGVLLANHGALTWGSDIYQAFFRLESMEYYALVTMYTNNIIGKTNELSCGQIDELVQIRSNLGIESGGIPPCSTVATNTSDVLRTQSNVQPPQADNSVLERQLTPAGCGCSVSPAVATSQSKAEVKQEVMAEVVRRVVEKMAQKG